MMLPDYETKLLQHAGEFDGFLKLIRDEGVRSYLEIGLGWGGSLWRVGNVLPDGSRIVAVDKTWTISARALFRSCLVRLKDERNHDGYLFLGNSRDHNVVEDVRALGPFDCIFIDGDHSYEGVKADWVNYAHMGKMVAFHDISWNETWVSKVPGRVTAPMGVPTLWNEIKVDYRHREFRLYDKGNYYGIGVLWRP